MGHIFNWIVYNRLGYYCSDRPVSSQSKVTLPVARIVHVVAIDNHCVVSKIEARQIKIVHNSIENINK